MKGKKEITKNILGDAESENFIGALTKQDKRNSRPAKYTIIDRLSNGYIMTVFSGGYYSEKEMGVSISGNKHEELFSIISYCMSELKSVKK